MKITLAILFLFACLASAVKAKGNSAGTPIGLLNKLFIYTGNHGLQFRWTNFGFIKALKFEPINQERSVPRDDHPFYPIQITSFEISGLNLEIRAYFNPLEDEHERIDHKNIK